MFKKSPIATRDDNAGGIAAQPLCAAAGAARQGD